MSHRFRESLVSVASFVPACPLLPCKLTGNNNPSLPSTDRSETHLRAKRTTVAMAEDRFSHLNPFAKRESHSAGSVIAYKLLTILTWLLALVSTVYYSIHRPHDGHLRRGNIWDQNWAFPSGFTLNSVIVEVYGIVIFVLQAGYIGHLFSSNLEHVNSACAVGSHFILNNLLLFGWVMLFVRSHFVWSELLLIVNFFNLSSLYFRHNAYPRFIHTPAVSGPLAWTFIAIYWNGAIAVHAPNSLIARIFANIFVWSLFVYGEFFIITYKDYTMGFALSVLTAALGVAQFERQFIAFQWIFAFTIMGLLFVSTVVIALPSAWGREVSFGRREPPAVDSEQAPLLGEN